MKTKQKLFLLFLIFSILSSCQKDDSKDLSIKIDATVKNTEDYIYDLNISGDEEGAIIKVQANHYQISELIRNSSTNWSIVYHYRPETNFVGTDYVEIETCTGGQGTNCSNIENIIISITIVD